MIDAFSKMSPQGQPEAKAGQGAGKARGQGFFEVLVQNLPEAVAVLREGLHIHCNPAYAHLFGFPDPGELTGRSLEELVPAGEILARLRESSGAWSQDVEGLTRDGEPLMLGLSAHPFRQGNTVYFALAARDLRVLWRAQQVIQKSERWWRHMFRMSLVGMVILERDGRVLAANDALCALAGLSQGELLGMEWREFVPDLSLADLIAMTDQDLAEDWAFGPRPTFFCHRDGRVRPVQIDVSPVFRPDGQVDQLIVLVQDLREHRRTEGRLQETEAQTALLLAAVEQSPVSIVITDEAGAIEYVNPKFSELTGYSPEEALGRNPRILKSGVQGPEVYAELWRTIESGQTWKGELCNRKKNGDSYWEQATLSPILNEGRITHYLAVKEDITEHRALQASQARLVEAVDQAAELIVVEDLHGRLINANQAFVRLTGLEAEAWRGRRALSLLPREGRGALVRTMLNRLKEGRPWQGKLRILKGDGTLCTLSGTVSLLRPEGFDPFFTCVFRDITAELEMDRHLRQVEKMEALGALASGVAHDFNNVLTAIMNSAELIEWQLPEDSPARPKLKVIMQAANRAKDLNRRILTFSRPTEERRIPFDLTAVVKECVHLLKSTVPKDVEIRSELSSSVWTMGDPAQIHQVVMNLAVNALHALDGKGWLELGLTEVDTDPGFLPAGAKAALLTVRDSGCGMDAETLEHVFEPFYTTKGTGGGTGLGLSVVHGVVTQHGGVISIDSQPGRGTLVKVHLPSAAVEISAMDETPQEELRGTEHLLVVDVEEVRVALTKESLQHLGYHVTSKSDPHAALDAFKEHPAIFDVVLLEYSKGAIPAEEFARRVRKLRPNIAIILASGSLLESSPESPFDEVLTKPVSIRDLGHALRRVLDARKRAARVEVSAAPSRERARTGEILLAEDSPVTLSLLRTWLVKAGYRVREARDGQEAWEIYVDQGAASFAMVLSDIVMPRMDGIRLVERIREIDPDIPVALLSSSEDVEAMKSALHLQVSEFLTKPFDSAALISCVERLVSGVNVRQRSAETAQAVRMAQRALVAVPEKDLPLYLVHQSLTDAGGDVFRCFKQPDGSILFILADVAGHSVISSYAVAAFLGLLSSLVPQNTDISTLALRLNRGIQEGPFSEVPVCVLLGHWAPRSGRLHVLNAGLPHGLCGGPTRRLRISTNGTPLGVFDVPMVDEKVLMLEAGERVLFASDGFFDIRGRDGELMEDLALNLWCDLGDAPIQEAVSILAGTAQALAEEGLEDDLLAVGFEQPVPEPGTLRLHLPSEAAAIDGAILQLTAYLGKAPRSIPLTHSRTFDILTAAREALTNAMIHGNGSRPDRRIDLSARWEEAPPAFTLQVVDEGLGFDLQALQSPTDPLSERGRGIPYLRNCASRVGMVGGELSITFSWEA